MRAAPASPHRIRRLALATALAFVPAAAAAQADSTSILRVAIRAEEGGAPVAGARVELQGLHLAANTDAGGVARIAGVPPGPVLVEIRKLGFGAEHFPLVVHARDTLSVEVDLQTVAVRLAGVTATAQFSRGLRESGFFQRKTMGIGAYALRTEWEGRGRLAFGDVVRRMRGIRVGLTADGRSLLVPSRPAASLSGCAGVQIYVDGVQLHVDGKYDDVNNLVPLAEVEAVETYAGPSEIPPQYNATGSACAVVLVWRRA